MSGRADFVERHKDWAETFVETAPVDEVTVEVEPVGHDSSDEENLLAWWTKRDLKSAVEQAALVVLWLTREGGEVSATIETVDGALREAGIRGPDNLRNALYNAAKPKSGLLVNKGGGNFAMSTKGRNLVEPDRFQVEGDDR